MTATAPASTKTGLLLVNLGTPDAPRTPEVRRYLREFLSDPRVIDIPAPLRWALVNLIIAPFRAPKSAEAYREIWEEGGSPLLRHGNELRDALRTRVGDRFQVELAMRYQNPSVASVLDRFHATGVDRIVVFPLFPQYASAAWGSAVECVLTEAGKRWDTPTVQVVEPYYDHPAFVSAVAAIARPVLDDFGPDLVLQSYHGVPERHCTKSDASGGRHCLVRPDCCDAIVQANRNCYRAQCHASARAISAELGLADDRWEIVFQSRLGRTPWIRPYLDERIPELGAQGVKRIAVLTPSFAADCLETLEEIGIRTRETFQEAGGEELILVPCLNADPRWADAVVRIVDDQVRVASSDARSRWVIDDARARR